MSKEPGRRTIVYSVLAVLLFAALFFMTFRSGGKNEGEQPEIVAFGDSVFGLVRDGTAIPAQLQELLGRRVYNAALGGTAMARQAEDRRMDYGKSALSLAGLVKAVQAGDFGPQRTLRIRENAVDYFPEVIEGLAEVDFSQVDTVLIQYGLNDYHNGTRIDDPEDPYDEYTFLGALRTGVRSLREINPDLRILLVTPTYAWLIYSDPPRTYQEVDQGEGVLGDYVEALLQAARELDLEVIDVYHDFYPHEQWEDWKLYTTDGLHPNEAGRRKLAERIAEAVESGAAK